ncbi:MAG TPA: IPT/TIG domain-containing protein [Acidobacteriaceae bacterium]|nr:IPT/TIG domain-containing protein [Acidobacteriaceae bacterium]
MPPARPLASRIARRSVAAALLLFLSATVCASGPRWVVGPPYFTDPNAPPVKWYTNTLLYFTDPAGLSPYVTHAQADAIVAAAASVWNVPTASITLTQGGTLAEHISSSNSYLSATGPVFPADVQPSNYAAIQIAVLYDSDGSLTDMLLGSGASSPFECRQNAVTEDVDSITPAATIQHAILILNGRCTGPAPEQQLQLQYQLERAFGRILGLAWSQTNDNVFTRTPQPTTQQADNWPILHPIDIICGPYTYQCLPSPFTLRDDDLAAVSGLYPNFSYTPYPSPTPAPGKQWSYIQAGLAYGTLSFPTGQGMDGVNLVLQRWRGGTAAPEPWDDVSAVSGINFRVNNGNPVTGSPGSSWSASLGITRASVEGGFTFYWVPLDDPLGSANGPMLAVITTEPINPLYVGAYSVGPYRMGPIDPSGPPQTITSPYPIWPFTYSSAPYHGNFPPTGASTCSTSTDGTEATPAPVDPSGWWSGTLCAYGHTAWSSFSMKPNTAATLEVTALDDSGYATTSKAMPLLGVWNSTDPTGTLPTVAASPASFNTIALGTTAARIPASSAAQSLRFVIADARGHGRPDFAYRARLLYADHLQPSAVSLSGGVFTIAGTGFRPGNSVTIGGLPATVTSWTSTSITAIAPPASSFGATPVTPLDVTISDSGTAGSATISSALTYSASVAPDILQLVSAPPSLVAVNQSSSFAVRVLLADGITPVPNAPVIISFSGPYSGSLQTSLCPASPCTLLTDASGLASLTVTPNTWGSFTLQASAVGSSLSASFAAVDRSASFLQPTLYIASDTTLSSPVISPPQLAVLQNSAPAANISVTWTGSPGISFSPATSTTDAQGLATTIATLGPLAPGSQAAAQACAWSASPPSACAGLTAIAVPPADLRLHVVSGANQTIPSSTLFAPVVLKVTDTAGHPVAGATVDLYQTVDALELPCPATGPCPIPPTLARTTATAISDAGGLVTLTPLQIPATAETTSLAAATGTQGFIALSLIQQP